jgi:hypothetical protein
MKYAYALIFPISLLFLCSCTMFDSKQPDPVGLPVGNNWQIIEEAPKLSGEQGRLPFQKEQSVQPEGEKHLSPAENRTIRTPL